MSNGAIVEVVANPQDGYWVLARYMASPDNPAREGTEEMIFVYDIAEEMD